MTCISPSEIAHSVSYAHIEVAATQLAKVAHYTPVMTSRTVGDRTQCQVFFKCENFQRTGSFKFRGAYNALAHLTPEQQQQGVVTYSSGNHAQGIALAGQLLSIPTTIVMPKDAPLVKQDATRGYGATVVLYDRAEASRVELCQQLARDRGMTIIPPYNHPHVIAGQGTTAKELIDEVGALDFLFVCCGGGGLLSGCAIATRSLSPNCRVIGVEPATANDAAQSFHSKTLHTIYNPETIADGARTPSLGSLTFPLVLHYVDDIVTVSDDALLRSMAFLWERLKIVVEPTGVLAAAALLEGVVTPPPGSRVGVVLTGGNVDLRRLSQLLA